MWSCQRPSFWWWWETLWSRETLFPKTKTERLHGQAILLVPLPFALLIPPLAPFILVSLAGLIALYRMHRNKDYGKEFEAAAWAVTRSAVAASFWVIIFFIAFLTVLFGDTPTP
jgi:hypothetical protein